MQKNYVQEILNIIHGNIPQAELAEKLSDYHEKDLADALEALMPAERKSLYPILGVDEVAEIFAYLDDAEPYLKELSRDEAAKVISNMDSDDAADALEDLDEIDKGEIVNKLDRDSIEDVKMLLSYSEDEIGSKMTTNYIRIKNDMTIRQAMSELVKQAGENDNISVLYVVDENEHFYGAIDLKDLIIARAEDPLAELIVGSYPYVTDREKISDCIERIVDYAERSLPVLNEAGKLMGIITSSDVVELVDDEMSDDYAKLGGLTGEEDLRESVFESVKKRLPWLTALLFLGMLVSSVVGAFESVVAVLPVGVPYFSVISTSLINLRGYGLAPGNFTIAHYVELFTENEKGLSALKNSVFLAVTSATICAVLGTLLVLAVRKSHSKLRKVVEAIGLLPEMLPGIVLVIGIMLFWNQIYNILPLYNTMGIMVLAYVVLFLPYTVQYVTSSFTQISDSLMAAGQVFGGSPVYILRRITLPLIRQGIATGWMMTFIIAFRELVTASLIAPPNTLVVSTFIVREFEQGSVSVGMAMAVLCVLFSTTALLILNTVIDHRKVH